MVIKKTKLISTLVIAPFWDFITPLLLWVEPLNKIDSCRSFLKTYLWDNEQNKLGSLTLVGENKKKKKNQEESRIVLLVMFCKINLAKEIEDENDNFES